MAITSWLGRGYESVPGRPFGWAFHRERDEIRAHLKRRGRTGYLEFQVTKIQQRIHKYKPTFAQRQAAARERGEKWAAPVRPVETRFTVEELERLAEHFAGANDPVAQSIAAKAAILAAGA